MMCQRLLIARILLLATIGNTLCHAQQVYTAVPLVSSNGSFYESFGTDWGFSHRGRNGYVFFNRGGANTGFAPFGGFDPNAVARFGFGSRGPGGSFYFNAWAGQGSNRTITSAAPSLTVQNGSSGYFQDVTVRPFVTGLIPVVGDRAVSPVAISPVEERIKRLRQEAAIVKPRSQPTDAELLLGAAAGQPATSSSPASSSRAPSRSSAERGDISLAEIRRQQATRKELDPKDELNNLIGTAQVAEASGHRGAARIRYQQAAAKATGTLQRALLAKCESLRD